MHLFMWCPPRLHARDALPNDDPSASFMQPMDLAISLSATDVGAAMKLWGIANSFRSHIIVLAKPSADFSVMMKRLINENVGGVSVKT